MDTGSANLMQSPQWIHYGASAAQQPQKWYINGNDHVTPVGQYDAASLRCLVQSPSAAANAFYNHRATVPSPHPGLPSPSALADVMYHHHQQQQQQGGRTTTHADVLPKFPPPMFDIPDIQDSNSVFECDERRAHLQHGGQAQPQRHLAPGWSNGHQSHYWSHSASLPGTNGCGGGGTGGCSAGSNSSNSSPGNSMGEDALLGRCENAGTACSVAVGGLVTNTATQAAPLLQSKEVNTMDGVSPVQVPTTTATTTSSTKRTKSPKKRKKRDPNEPQKPVSAYSLFFRNAQAAIKNRNPNATFGDVSKIVASMWDNLDDSVKNYYKRQMEVAKKDYLKQLAIYRASLTSNGVTAASATPPVKVSSEDSVETIGSRNENEADQLRHSPSSSNASLLHVDGDMSNKMVSPPTDGVIGQYSPVGQSTSPTMTSLQLTVNPPLLQPGHSMPPTAALFAAAGNSYFPRYVNQRFMADPVTSPHYMPSAGGGGCYDNGSNYYMRPSYPPISYNTNMATNRQYVGSQTEFQLLTGTP